MRAEHPDLKVASGAELTRCEEASTDQCPRLVVVVQDGAKAAFLANRVLDMAYRRGLGIRLLGATPDPDGAARLRRQLVTIAAFIRQEQGRLEFVEGRGPRGKAPEIAIESSRDWLHGIKVTLHTGDIVVCEDGQAMGMGGRMLNDVLASTLNVPIFILTALQSPQSHPGRPLSRIAAWVCSVASIGGFLLLQAQIVTQVQGFTQTALLILALGAEVAWLWFLNRLFGAF